MSILNESIFREINFFLNKGLNLRIDVGLSYNAPYLIKWARTNEKIIVVGFEPHPLSFSKLEEEISKLSFEIRSRIFIFNCAISDVDEPSTKKFYSTGFPNSTEDPGRSSLLKPIGSLRDTVVETHDVTVISLDYFLNKMNYRIIEFIKIDTQGTDLEVAKSLKLHILKVYMIQAERDSTEFYNNATTGSALDEFMLHNNFIQVSHTKDNMDSLFVNSMIKVLDFVPFRLDIITRKFPKTLIKFAFKSPIIFLQISFASIFYVSHQHIIVNYFKLKHLGKVILKKLVSH
jgi:FkbM family methyltransferase